MGSLSEILFVAAAIIGLVSSRIFLFGTGEGGVKTSALRRSLGLVSMVLTYSLFAWGFVSLSWYWPLVAYLVAAIVAAIVVTFSPWRLLYSRRSLRAAICGLNIGLSCNRRVRAAPVRPGIPRYIHRQRRRMRSA